MSPPLAHLCRWKGEDLGKKKCVFSKSMISKPLVSLGFLISEKGFKKIPSIMFLIPSTGFSLFQATILLILNTRFLIYKQRFSYFKEFWARGFWFQAWQILIPTQGVSYFKNFEHKVFAFQAKGSLFQEFWAKSSLIPSMAFFLCYRESTECFIPQAKGFFLISRILSIESLEIGCEGTRIILL